MEKKPFIHLDTADSRQKLFDLLQGVREVDDTVLPLHNMLNRLLVGLIGDQGQVFVDAWPEFSMVICLHAAVYSLSMADKLDIVTAWAKPEVLSTLSHQHCLKEIANFRCWGYKRSIAAFYLTDAWITAFEGTLPSSTLFKRRPKSRTYLSPLVPDADTKPFIEQQLRELKETVLPQGFKVDYLKPEESFLLADNGGIDIPDRYAYYRYLVERLGCMCIRDIHGSPVAWVGQHTCGGGASRYVLPQYRRLNFNALVDGASFLELVKTNQTMPFAGVNENNTAAIESFMKHNPESRISKVSMAIVVMEAKPSNL